MYRMPTSHNYMPHLPYTQDEVAIKRAEEFLNALVEGQQVRKDKVEWSLQVSTYGQCLYCCSGV